MGATFSVGANEFTVQATIGELPATYSSHVDHAVLHDDFGIQDSEGTVLIITVTRSSEWPELVVSQRFEPGPVSGFHPGTLLIPETGVFLIGAGTRLLAYDLRAVERLWEDSTYPGFWDWKRHGNVILMHAELELGAWDLQAEKLWSRVVEPPWDYKVRGARIELDVTGRRSTFDLETGPLE